MFDHWIMHLIRRTNTAGGNLNREGLENRRKRIANKARKNAKYEKENTDILKKI